MFGLIISGRPVDATPTAITEAQYAFRISPAPSFNHIVVFLLPGTQLPEGTAASVYAQIPPSAEFRFLGGIGPGKESAIFRINGAKSGGGGDGDAMVDESMALDPSLSGAGAEFVVGVSIEAAAQVEAQMAGLRTPAQMTSSSSSTAIVRSAAISPGSALTTKVLAQRIIGNAFNFLASFGSDVVPLKAFQEWWTKFEKRVELDPSFLEREQG